MIQYYFTLSVNVEVVVNGVSVKGVVVDDSISFASFKISGCWTNQLHICNWLVIVLNWKGGSEV